LFTDIEGSTRLIEELGEDPARLTDIGAKDSAEHGPALSSALPCRKTVRSIACNASEEDLAAAWFPSAPRRSVQPES
jgi:hypothetical protein